MGNDGEGSIASSRASTSASSHKERAVVTFFSETIPIFPFFRSLEPQHSATITYLGNFIVFLQMLSFALPFGTKHGEALSEVAPVLYTTHLPFWDSRYVVMTLDEYFALFWICVALVLVPLLVSLWLISTNISIHRDLPIMVAIRSWFHLIYGPLCIPLLHCLLAVATCSPTLTVGTGDTATNVLHSFPETACNEVASRVGLAAAIFSIVVYVVLGLFCFPTLIEIKYGDENPWAKANGAMDFFLIIWKCLSVIVFHVFRSQAALSYISLWVGISALFLAVGYAFSLPYYSHRSNSWYTACMLYLFWVGVISFLSHDDRLHVSFTRTDMDVMFTLIFALPTFLIGDYLCRIRINPRIFYEAPKLTDMSLQRSGGLPALGKLMGAIDDGTEVTSAYFRFPEGLPTYELSVQGNEEILKDIEDSGISFQDDEVVGSESASGQTPAGGSNSKPSLVVSYLTNIHISSDVGLSTRFLDIFRRVTGGRQPRPQMILFAARIFMKGLCRWWESVTILLQYGNALLVYADRPRLALVQMDRCNRADATFSQRFHVFRMSILMKQELNIRDGTYQKICDRARKLHKECLVHMAYFWNKLLPVQVDTFQLANLMNLISSTRTACEEEFSRALAINISEKTLLGKYASFLEHIMLDTDAAERLRFIVKNDAEERRRQTGRRAVNARTEQELTELFETLSEKRSNLAGRNGRWMVVLVLFLVLGGLAGFEASAIIAQDRVTRQLRSIDAAGQTRALSAEGGLIALQYLLNTSETFSTHEDQRSALVQRSLDLSSLQHSLSFGTLKPTDTETINYMAQQYVIQNDPLFFSRERNRTLKTIEFGRYSSDVAARLQIAASEIVEDKTTNSYFDLVRNFDFWTPIAFNRSVISQEKQAKGTTTELITMAAIFFGLSIGLLLTLYAILAVRDRAALGTSVAVLQLFTLIPKPPAATMAKEAKERVQLYDESESSDEQSQMRIITTTGSPAGGPAIPGDDMANMNETAALLAGNSSGGNTDGKEGGNGDEQSGLELTYDGDSAAQAEQLAAFERQKQEGVSAEDQHSSVMTTSAVVMLVISALFIALTFAFSVVTLQSINVRESDLGFVLTEVDNLERQQTNLRLASIKTLKFLQTGLEEEALAVAEHLSAAKLATQISIETTTHFHRRDWMPTLMNSASVLAELAEIYETAIDNFRQTPSVTFADFPARSDLVNTTGSYYDVFPPNHPSELTRINMLGVKTETLLRLATSSIRELVDNLKNDLNKLVESSSTIPSKISTTVMLALACVSVVASLPLLHEVIVSSTRAQYYPRWAKAGSILSLLCSIVVIVISVLLLQAHDVGVKEEVHAIDVFLAKNETLCELDQRARNAKSFTQVHDLRFYDEYWHELHLLEATDLYKNKNELLTRIFADMAIQESVALRLTANAFAIDPDRVKEVNNFTWNIETEETWPTVRQLYPKEPLRYNSTEVDETLSLYGQSMVSRHTMFSDRYDEELAAASEEIGSYYDDELSLAKKRRDRASSDLDVFSVVTVALCAVCVVCIVMLGIAVARLRHHTSEQFAAHYRTASAFLPFRIMVFIILICLSSAFAVSVYRTSQLNTTVKSINAATTREWLVPLSVIVGEKLNAHELHNDEAIATLTSLTQEMNLARQRFYFGMDGTTTLTGDDTGHDSLLFGQYQQLDANYQCGYQPANTLPVENLLRRGISSAVETFMLEVEELRSQARARAFLNMTTMRLTVFPTLRALRQSSAMYLDSQLDKFATLGTIEAILIACAIFLLIVTAWLVILPMLNQHESEAAASLLLVNMIPKEVREGVPCVSEFIAREFGDSEANASANSSSDSGSGTDMLTTVPIVSIDFNGIVLKYNTSAEQLFGFTAAEVVGNKVNMLMAPQIAAKHDYFLQRYRETRRSNLVGTSRQVVGQHAKGYAFPIELRLSEHVCESGETVFIAFITDVSRLLELQRAEKLNTTIQEMATVPMIAIDTLGTVIRFNRASEQCFGHNASDVLSSNVKILMPEEHAKYHDSYLANYLRTGKKYVIDNIRHVQGLRKNGEEFPMRLAVKQISTSDGTGSTYLAFAEDMTQELVLDEANVVNDIIANLSPIPIIGIDIRGKVLKFSRAASDLFGYQLEEVLGNNIKMLMPPEISDMHDGYLEAYRRTGIRRVIGKESELTALHKDGRVIHVRSLIREVKHEGVPPIYVGYLQDYSEVAKQRKEMFLNREVIEINPCPVFMTTPKGIITKVNRAALLEFGYREEELLGENVKKIVSREHASDHDSFLERYVTTRQARLIGKTRRVSARRKNGDEFPIEILVDEVSDEDNTIKAFIGMLINLQTRVDMETYTGVADAISALAQAPIVSIDSKGTILSMNQQALETWEYARHECIGRNVKMLMNEHDAKLHDGYLENYARTRKKKVINSVRVVDAKRKKSGRLRLELMVKEVKTVRSLTIDEEKSKMKTRRAGSSRGSRASDNDSQHSSTVDGEIDSTFVAYFKDSRGEAESQALIQRIEKVAELSPTPLIRIDQFGVVKEFNQAAGDQFGYEPDHVISRNIRMLMPPQIAKMHDTYLANYRRTRVRHVIGNLRQVTGQRRDGSTFPCEIRVSEVEGADSSENCYLGYLKDITNDLKLKETNASNSIISVLSPTPIISISANGTVISFNDAATKTFLWEVDAIVGQNIKVLMPEEIASKHDGFLMAYQKTGEKHVIDSVRKVTAKRKDGTLFRGEIMVKEIRKEGQTQSNFLGSFRDCALDDEIELGSKIAEAIDLCALESMLQVDSNGFVSKVNSFFSRQSGYSLLEVAGTPISRLLPSAASDRSFLMPGVKEATLMKKGSNETVPVTVTVRSLVFDDQSKILFVSVRDNSKTRQLAAEIRRVAAVLDNCHAYAMVVAPFFGKEGAEWENNAVNKGEVTEFKIEYASNSLVGCLKYEDQDELMGELMTLVINSKELRSALKEHMIAHIRNGGKSTNGMLKKLEQLKIAGTLKLSSNNNNDPNGSISSRGSSNNQADEDGFAGGEKPVSLSITEIPMAVWTAASIGLTSAQLEGLQSEFGVDSCRFFIQFTDEMVTKAGLVARERNELLRSMLQARNAILKINEGEKIESVNHGVLEQFGYEESELLGKSINTIIPSGVLKQYKSMPQAKRGEPATFPEMGIFAGAMVVLNLEVTVSAFMSDTGARKYMVVVNNVTAQKMARRDEQLSNAVIDTCAVPTVVIDAQGTIKRFSEGAAQEFGFSQLEVIGRNVNCLMPKSTAVRHDSFLSAYQTTGKRNVIDQITTQTAQRKDKSTFPIELHIREIDLGGGRKNWFMGVLRNAEEAQKLGASVAYFDCVERAIEELICICSAKGTILSMTTTLATLLGFEKKDMVGKNIRSICKDRNFVTEGEYPLIELDGAVDEAAAAMTNDNSSMHTGSAISASDSGGGGSSKAEKSTAKTTSTLDSAGRSKVAGHSFQKVHRFAAHVSTITKEVTVGSQPEAISITRLRDLSAKLTEVMGSEISSEVLSASPDALVEIDIEGNITRFNQAAEIMFDFKAHQIRGKNVKLLMPDGISARHQKYIDAFMRTGQGKRIDKTTKLQAERKNGELFDCELTLKAIKQTSLHDLFGVPRFDPPKKMNKSQVKIKEGTVPAPLVKLPSEVDDMYSASEIGRASMDGSTNNPPPPKAQTRVHDDGPTAGIVGFVALIRDLNPPEHHTKQILGLNNNNSNTGGASTSGRFVKR